MANLQENVLNDNQTEYNSTKSSDYSERDDEDDEATLEEEEAFGEDDVNELDDLQGDAELTIEQLMAKYNAAGDLSDAENADDKEQPAKKIRLDEDQGPSSSQLDENSEDSLSNSALLYLANGPRSMSADVDDDDDADYVPKLDGYKPPRIGPDFQCTDFQFPITKDINNFEAEDDIHSASPIWLPNIAMCDKDVSFYEAELYTDVTCGGRVPDRVEGPFAQELTKVREQPEKMMSLLREEAKQNQTLNSCNIRDNEDMLYILMKQTYMSEAAKEQYESHYQRTEAQRRINTNKLNQLMNYKMNSILENQNSLLTKEDTEGDVDLNNFAMNVDDRVAFGVPPDRKWTMTEEDLFEAGFAQMFKNFHLIQSGWLPHRTTAELVYYYYRWKKTERGDMFRKHVRLEKRHFLVHPDATDHMEHLMTSEQQALINRGQHVIYHDSNGQITLLQHAGGKVSLSGAGKSPPYTTITNAAHQFIESESSEPQTTLPTLEPHFINQMLRTGSTDQA